MLDRRRPLLDEPPAASESAPVVGSAQLQRFKRWLRLFLGAAAVVFVAYACFKLAARWESGKVKVSLLPLVISMVPLALGTVVLALGWQWLLERMLGRRIPTKPAVCLHIESQLARYTPGKVGMPLVRIAGATQLGSPGSTIASSVLIEVLPFLSVGGGVGFLCLWLTADRAQGALGLVSDLGIVGLVLFSALTLLLVLVDRRRFPARLNKLLGTSGEGPLVPLSVPLAHVAYWLTWAVHGYLASRSVGIEASASLAGTGLYVLAPIAGFLALATPSGIGVREAVISVSLAPLAGPAPAVAAAIVSRATSMLVDFLAWVVARAFFKVPV
jgi:glycosyltransferase 2 family protein